MCSLAAVPLLCCCAGFKTATPPPMRAESDEPSGVPMRAETDVPSGEATTRAVGGSQCELQSGAQLVQLARLAQSRAASRQAQTLADIAAARARWQA